MRSFVLAFLIGVLILQNFSALPQVNWVAGIIVFAVLIRFCFKKWWELLRIPIAIAIGFSWALWSAHAYSAWTLPENLAGKPIRITGYIASIPNATLHGTAFLFSLYKLNNQSVRGLVHLTWDARDAKIDVGDKWQLYVRLKKPYGTMNPGGFDYEALAFQEGIRAHGYVTNETGNLKLNSHWYKYTIDRVRQFFKEKIAANLPVTNTSPWITALSIGERHDIDESDWQVLRNTGTNHLMAIAGLHIGFMAALAHYIFTRIWKWIPRLALIIPAQHVGAIAALAMAFIYSAMAGFSIPTQRACLMLTVFLLASLLRRNIVAWQAWCSALFCVLLINPLSVLTESFWLSFGSVALIIYGVSGRLSPTGLWWKWGRIQWVIAVGLIPLSIGLFHQYSLIAFVANCIAIPWVGCIVVPLCFFGCISLLFSAKIGGLMLGLADKILNVLWSILTWFAHLPHVVWYQMVPHEWILATAIIGAIFALLPVGFPGRYFSILWLLPLVLFKSSAPKAGDIWFTLLDVGQGLSAIIQTQKHILVFDAGPRFGPSFDMGDSVVVPFLHSIGARNIDMLVVSHGDNDHIGGAQTVLSQLPVTSIKTSVPQKILNSTVCLRNTSWDWDGVNFEFLYPTPDKLNLNNNSSCVLRITSGNKHILLTGDIEKLAEKELVISVPAQLKSDILIAPHHGSKTSAVDDFVTAVNPHYVLFPLGYRNRYHFPHWSVIEKYEDLHANCSSNVDVITDTM